MKVYSENDFHTGKVPGRYITNSLELAAAKAMAIAQGLVYCAQDDTSDATLKDAFSIARHLGIENIEVGALTAPVYAETVLVAYPIPDSTEYDYQAFTREDGEPVDVGRADAIGTRVEEANAGDGGDQSAGGVVEIVDTADPTIDTSDATTGELESDNEIPY